LTLAARLGEADFASSRFTALDGTVNRGRTD
jgi:hypothetical protein